MSTQTTTQSESGGALLAELLTAVRPAAEAAAQKGGTAQQTTALITTSPAVTLFIEHRDEHGQLERVYRVPTAGPLAHAVGRFIVAGLNEALSVDVRRQVSELLERGASLAVRVELDFETATAAILSGDSEVDLFTLSGEVH